MARNKFDEDESLEAQFNLSHLKRLMGYVTPHKKSVISSILLMLLSSGAMLLGPFLIKEAIDTYIPQKNVSLLLAMTALYIVLLVVNAFCLRSRIRIMSATAQKIIASIRRDVFVHLQKLPFSYYDSRPHGKILIRVVNYVNSLNDLLQNGIINVITDLFSLICIVIYMLIINPRLTLIAMAGLPVLLLAMYLLKNLQRSRWQKLSQKQSNMNAYLHESLCGIKVTQSLAREDENIRIFDRCSSDVRTSYLRAVRINLLLWPVTENISVMTMALLYVVGLSWVSSSILTVGTIVAFVSYIGSFWQPIMNIGEIYNQVIVAMAYMERIFETLDEKVIVEDVPDSYALPDIRGQVDFRHVWFSYEDDQDILKDISFSVKPGETIALVGATGSGKTTIVNLISRFYNLKSGTISIDGHDISQVTLASLRSQMGIMMQDSFIFSGTIMDNIRYGKLDATDEEVMEAAKTVLAHEFIMEMENGYYTEVNERGSRLSMGQRQLISFARALLADPRILILDEATSSIDTRTEKALQIGLERLLAGRTSFVIAHRLSTIRNASRIFCIEDGRIIEAGSHRELMERKSAYHSLYTSQYEILSRAI